MTSLKVDLGFWGESFYVTSDGRCGVTDCNGDAVELEADQWRHVITLLTAHIDTPQKMPVVAARRHAPECSHRKLPMMPQRGGTDGP